MICRWTWIYVRILFIRKLYLVSLCSALDSLYASLLYSQIFFSFVFYYYYARIENFLKISDAYLALTSGMLKILLAP